MFLGFASRQADEAAAHATETLPPGTMSPSTVPAMSREESDADTHIDVDDDRAGRSAGAQAPRPRPMLLLSHYDGQISEV